MQIAFQGDGNGRAFLGVTDCHVAALLAMTSVLGGCGGGGTPDCHVAALLAMTSVLGGGGGGGTPAYPRLHLPDLY